MIRLPPRSTLSPDTTLLRSPSMPSSCPNPSTPRICWRPCRASSMRARRPNSPRGPSLCRGPRGASGPGRRRDAPLDRKSTRLNSSHANISYAVFCLKKNGALSFFLTLALGMALPLVASPPGPLFLGMVLLGLTAVLQHGPGDRKSTRLHSSHVYHSV